MAKTEVARPAGGDGSSSRGRVLVLAGPDGSGKSTVTQALLNGHLRSRSVMRIHHRPRMLPGRSSVSDVTQPHAGRPYPRWVSRAKLVYLYLDYLLGWLLRVAPQRRKGGWVLVERGWWDLVVDPARYRLASDGFARYLARLLPRPDVTFVLLADADVISQRKDELSRGEIERQSARWTEIAASDPDVTLLDASRDVHSVVADLVDHLEVDEDRGWIALPSRRKARLWLPRTPASAARAGLKLFHPMTTTGRWGWTLGRVVAASGATRLLPGATPSRAVLRSLGGIKVAWTDVAVARSNHPGRWAALLLDGRHPFAVAKIALDERGRRALFVEQRALSAASESLSSALRVPRLLEAAGGVLVMEAIDWRPRSEPWMLPPDIAAAIGGYNRVTGSHHGDFAPWNALEDRSGQWALIDWEHSGDGYPAAFDIWHFLVQGHSLLGRPTVAELTDGLEGDGWVGAALGAYVGAAGIDRSTLRSRLRDYLAASEGRLNLARSDGVKGSRARKRLAAKLDSAL